MDEISSISFNSIFADGSFKEYATLEQAIVSNPVSIVKSVSGIWKNGSYRNSICEFEIFDSEGNEVDSIKVGNWSLSNLRVSYGGGEYMYKNFQKTEVYFDLIDPKETITNKHFGKRFNAVLNAFKYLTKFSKFENIENLLLSEENEKLKEQIGNLSGENEKLKEQKKILVEIITSTKEEGKGAKE